MRPEVLNAAALLMLGGLLCLPDQSHAADESKVSPEREIRQLNDRIKTRQSGTQSLTGDFQPLGDWTRSDLKMLADESKQLIEKYQKAIEAWQKDDATTARRLVTETEPARDLRDWRRRLEARREQSQNWRGEKWAEEVQTKWGRDRARAYGAEWVAAARRASLAWGRYAESIAPGVAREKQHELEDAAQLAEAEIHAVEEKWRIRQTIDDRLWDKTITSPELEKRIRELEQLGERASEIMRKRAEADRQLREWQRERTRLERELEQAFSAARELEMQKRKQQK